VPSSNSMKAAPATKSAMKLYLRADEAPGADLMVMKSRGETTHGNERGWLNV